VKSVLLFLQQDHPYNYGAKSSTILRYIQFTGMGKSLHPYKEYVYASCLMPHVWVWPDHMPEGPSVLVWGEPKRAPH